MLIASSDEDNTPENYLVRTNASSFRVTDVPAFIEALKPWPQVAVESLAETDYDDSVTLDVAACDIDSMPLDHAFHWPYRKDGQADGTFDENFLQVIQSFLRPLQKVTLYEASYDESNEDFVRMAVVPQEGAIQQLDLYDVLKNMGAARMPFNNRIRYPGDDSYEGNGTGPQEFRY